MSHKAASYVPLIHSELMELKKLCGNVFHRQIRDAIAASESYLQTVGDADSIDLTKATTPFFLADKANRKLFQAVNMDLFHKIFTQASPSIYPDRNLTQEVVRVIFECGSNSGDEINIRTCNVIISCLQSPSGTFFVHGRMLLQMIHFLFFIYDSTVDPTALSSISSSISDIIFSIFNFYVMPLNTPAASSIKDLATLFTSRLIEQSLSIFHYLGGVLDAGSYTPTIRDVDVYVVLSLLAKVIEQSQMKAPTVQLAVHFLIVALRQTSIFFDTACFRQLLSSKIHLAVLGLSMNSDFALAKPTAELILILWQRFAPIYNEGLNEVLSKSLLTALKSPIYDVVRKTLLMYSEFAKTPQFFVDVFVNYDCDPSGVFQSTFEQTISQIAELSHPDKATSLQALALLVAIFGSLWTYFQSQQPTKVEKEDFLEAKKAKDEFNCGVDLFKKSSKRGIQYFIQKGIIKDNTDSIAAFLFNTLCLDPQMIGEYIAEEANSEVLMKFTALFDFRTSTFEQSFRTFLSKFRMSNDPQSVDRILTAFGSKFFNDSPNTFSNADTAYSLAYSTLMLHTDSHHPKVKARIALQQFIKSNAGIDNGKDLSPDLLKDLFERITQKSVYPESPTTLLTIEQKADLYRSQCEATLNEARQRSLIGAHEWRAAVSSDLVKPMFEAVWRNALAPFTIVFQQADDDTVSAICLKGLTYAVHIASHCYIDTALTTIVDSLATFTGLRSGVVQIQKKNIDCTNILLRAAIKDRNFLTGAWDIILEEASALDKNKATYKFDMILLDELFNSSSSLEKESMTDFISALCKVSKSELEEGRQFSLQKVGVVALMNIQKPPFIWMAVWNIIADFLFDVGTADNVEAAEVAIDILRQIATKFLAQKEKNEFHFQQNFLIPFQKIFEQDIDEKLKDLVLTCINNLINEKGTALASGWNVIFEILIFAALDERTQKPGFDIVKSLTDKHLILMKPMLVNLVSALSSYVNRAKDVEICVGAADCFQLLANEFLETDKNGWSALFTALCHCGQHSKSEVRTESQKVFIETFRVLIQKSDKIDQGVIDGIIKNDLKEFLLPSTIAKESEQMFSQEAIPFLTSLSEGLMKESWPFFRKHLASVFSLLKKSFCSKAEALGECSLGVFQQIVKTHYSEFNADECSLCVDELSGMAKHCTEVSVKNALSVIKVVESFFEINNFAKSELHNVLRMMDSVCVLASDPKSIIEVSTSVKELFFRELSGEADAKDEVVEYFNKMLGEYEDLKEKSEAWDRCIEGAMKQLNKLPDPLFIAIFEKSSNLLLELINCDPQAIRKNLTQTLKRKFA